MSENKEALLLKLSNCVLEMEDELVVEVANQYIEAGFSPIDGILEGLVDGMQEAAKLFEEEEYFIPELLVCSEAMYNGLNILKPHLDKNNFGKNKKIVLGIVEGDTHDIGKNLVKIMLEAAGYEVIDMGRDVSCESFVDKVLETKADLLAMSTLMSSTMGSMQRVIQILEEKNIREKVKVIIGGAPISLSFSKKIGADGYSSNAVEAVKLVDELLSV
ncbi:MAG TPA: cobalamin-binding protein [Clostridiales bacterium]|nr:cobalamin-binding protein [Clostridiales bacterium]